MISKVSPPFSITPVDERTGSGGAGLDERGKEVGAKNKMMLFHSPESLWILSINCAHRGESRQPLAEMRRLEELSV